MSHLFGLTPEQQELMTVARWSRYRKFADEWMKGQSGG